jgi:hypothetical protein
LKADVSAAGDGWSDGKIAESLDTSIATIERPIRQVIILAQSEGFERAALLPGPFARMAMPLLSRGC